MDTETGFAVAFDYERFFDTMDRRHLKSFLDKRVRDGMIRRIMGEWLKEGVWRKERFKRWGRRHPKGV